jgi:uncharacterized membrane protein SirB2
MSAYYPELRNLHIACAFASILLFVLRHVLSLRNVDWRKSKALRIMPHVVDSVLLASAISLTLIIEQYPFVNSWLTVKIIALVAYIILGMQALKADRTQAARRMAFVAAVIVFGFIVTVARTGSPLGIFVQFF